MDAELHPRPPVFRAVVRGGGDTFPGDPPGIPRAWRTFAGLVWLAFCLGGTYARIAGVGGQPLAGDENIAYRTIADGYAAIWTTFDGRGSHIGYSLLQRLSMDAFGESVLTYRLPSVLAGVLTVWLLAPLGARLVGGGPAWAASAILAVHPMHVHYSRDGRPYALAVLLTLLLLAGLERALRGGRSSWGSWALVVATAATLPWVHLSAAGTVVLLGLAAILGSWWTGGGVRASLRAFGAAGALCLALYASAYEGVVEYVSRIVGRSEGQDLGRLEVLEKLGGSLGAGLAIVAGGLLSSPMLCLRRPRAGILLLSAIVAPMLLLEVAQPPGVAWAYARYLLVALVPMLLAAGWGGFALAERVLRRPALAYLATPLLAALYAATSPTRFTELHLPFSKSEWVTMFSHPGLDEPFVETPALYRRLRDAPEPLTVVEFPYNSRLTLLYRNYQRQHGGDVLVGYLEGGLFNESLPPNREATPLLSRPPYVALRRSELPRTEADWLILHLDPHRELQRYARFVELRLPAREWVPLSSSIDRIVGVWGEPDYRDEWVLAWRLHPPGEGAE